MLLESPETGSLIPLIGLYAEIHYRFRFFPFSLYFRRMPEIIFDAPFRLEPSQTLPVFLIIKDADRFPIEVESVHLRASAGETTVVRSIQMKRRIYAPLWFETFELDIGSLPAREVEIQAEAIVRRGRRTVRVCIDNYPGLSHAPLRLYKASDPLPNLPGWTVGELHCHTEFGRDQVEFGAPLEVYRRAAEAIGLDWVGLTDHSYHLDRPRKAPHAHGWELLQEKTRRLNRTPSPVLLIPGEELTCRTSKGGNVHLLLLGNEKFLPGSGDSAQRWLRTRSELSAREALDGLAPETFACAAHPFSPPGLLERLLLGRRIWLPADLSHPRLDGWQIQNGAWGKGFTHGLDIWVESLNRRLPGDSTTGLCIYAGNDAHGNLNRFRQVKRPMLRLWETGRNLFGKVTTRALARSPAKQREVLEALRNGRAAISDGPALDLSLVKDGRIFSVGSTVDSGAEYKLLVRYRSTPEFGSVEHIDILTSHRGREKPLRRFDRETLPHPFAGEFTFSATGELYFRAELVVKAASGEAHRCLTNPIRMKKPEVAPSYQRGDIK